MAAYSVTSSAEKRVLVLVETKVSVRVEQAVGSLGNE
jgi:hypothetical protein